MERKNRVRRRRRFKVVVGPTPAAHPRLAHKSLDYPSEFGPPEHSIGHQQHRIRWNWSVLIEVDGWLGLQGLSSTAIAQPRGMVSARVMIATVSLR